MADFTEQLKQLMQARGLASFKLLQKQASISKHAVNLVRQGQADLLKYRDLQALSLVLHISVEELLQNFSDLPNSPSVSKAELQAEYQRLQTQINQQRQELQTEFKQSVIQQLESWLLQWPSAVYAAQNNAAMPARNLIPLLRPLEDLLKKWGIEAIATVGEEVTYDPQLHQLMNADKLAVGETVVVRYVGYRQEEKLLYRARVSPKS